jgi:hypothetical protein
MTELSPEEVKALVAVGTGAAGYVAKTIGSVPQDLIGVLGADWLHEKRRRNLARLQRESALMIDALEADRISEPSPSLVIPLLTSAVDEGREELGRMWAALLANVMVDQGKRVRRDFFETLRQLEPEDAVLLETVRGFPYQGDPSDAAGEKGKIKNRTFLQESLAQRQLGEDRVVLSIATLRRMLCIAFPGLNVAPSELPRARLTSFGRELLLACSPPTA